MWVANPPTKLPQYWPFLISYHLRNDPKQSEFTTTMMAKMQNRFPAKIPAGPDHCIFTLVSALLSDAGQYNANLLIFNKIIFRLFRLVSDVFISLNQAYC